MPDSAPNEATALRFAARSGKSVAVESATSETEEVHANPDGSLTWSQSTLPVRVKRGDEWVPVDLTLERRADGSFGPKASTVDVAFSGGGPGSADDALARVAQGGRSVGLGWHSDLPVPVVDGAALTYPDVLPDVDLRVEAHQKGFSQLLVVRTPQAAGNPALNRISFRTHAENVTVHEGPADSGSLIVKDAAGAPAFVGGAAHMWDSSGGGSDGLFGDGDRRAAMDVEVTPDAVAVVPDQAFLNDPSTTYPVSLDPEYHCGNCGKTHHVVVQSPWPFVPNYDRTDGDLNDLKAGKLNASALEAHEDGVSRSYVQMNSAPLLGRFIHGAVLKTRVVNTFSCAPSPTGVWLAGWFDAYTTWDYQPGPLAGWENPLAQTNVRNNPAKCPEDGNAGFDVTTAVRAGAADGWSWLNFMLQAMDENDMDDSWRRFDLNPYLEVRYNSYPNQPTDMGIEGWGPNGHDALPCRVGPQRTLVTTRTPRLRARLSDPDGHLLDAGFRIMVGPKDNYTWNGQEVHVGDIGSGNFAEAKVPAGWIANDGVHTWHLWSGDYQLSKWSENCEFEVDTVKPNTPAVSSEDYPASGVHGTVGQTGTFTFRTNGNTGPNGTMDVRKYGWSLNNDTATTRMEDVAADGDGTVSLAITPVKAGINVLYVSAFDRAGNRSAANAVYVFEVAEPAVPLASWPFNESSGSTATDASGGGRELTLQSGASFASGYDGNALSLNGSTGFAKSSAAVLDTSRAFTVSAWVKLDRTDTYHTVLSQDGTHNSPFFLQYSKDVDRWTMSASTGDTVPADVFRAPSASPPAAGVWTHLLSTYEPDSSKVALYVNGKPEGTLTMPMWQSTGSLVVGAGKWGGNREGYFPGSIDGVRVWDRALSAGEAATQANETVLRARLALDEMSGATTLEQVSGQQATIAPGVTWAGTPVTPERPDQQWGGEDKWLNFTGPVTREVTAPRPALLRTDRSYSVSAWVRLEAADALARSAVGFGDTGYSPFMIQYRPENRQWGFLVNRFPDHGGFGVALSDNEVEAGKWVHLVGTYDAVAGRIALYVNGVRQTVNFMGTGSSGQGMYTWNGNGPLWLGRGIWSGNKSDLWRGDIDDARVYSGVLSTHEVQSIQLTTRHN
ncbi:LamG-like jellyroll fold domain-containing protein [Saccharothrix obliqua]|uniref:LamG-like jellyroll fold domain-containing protein n=1 Tax=Saccharothrix obliqua TaxID=2861747 RepID=UPI001C5F5A22|nr:LamG-like jellyroll fold domain-containing protein [Saccharothrix obliqua]MBW4719979.1 LamG domain-containing protein [Saccharothrix obliqua]